MLTAFYYFFTVVYVGRKLMHKHNTFVTEDMDVDECFRGPELVGDRMYIRLKFSIERNRPLAATMSLFGITLMLMTLSIIFTAIIFAIGNGISIAVNGKEDETHKVSFSFAFLVEFGVEVVGFLLYSLYSCYQYERTINRMVDEFIKKNPDRPELMRLIEDMEYGGNDLKNISKSTPENDSDTTETKDGKKKTASGDAASYEKIHREMMNVHRVMRSSRACIII